MSNSKAIVISLLVSVFAVIVLFSYINSRERAILEMATPIQVIVATRDIPEGTRIDSAMIESVAIPQKYVQPGSYSDPQRVVNRNVTVPLLKGTQVLETMFAIVETESISAKIPTENRAFSIFVTDVTAVGQLIQPGDMIDIMVTVETGSYSEGQGVREEIITKTVLENILVLAVNQTSSVRHSGALEDMSQRTPGSVFRAGQRSSHGRHEEIKTLTVSVSPREVQVLNLCQEIGTISAALRSSFDSGRVDNLPPLSARDLLGIEKQIIPRSRPAWVEIRGTDTFSRY